MIKSHLTIHFIIFIYIKVYFSFPCCNEIQFNVLFLVILYYSLSFFTLLYCITVNCSFPCYKYCIIIQIGRCVGCRLSILPPSFQQNIAFLFSPIETQSPSHLSNLCEHTMFHNICLTVKILKDLIGMSACVCLFSFKLPFPRSFRTRKWQYC